MNAKKISIVVPVYNEAPSLRELHKELVDVLGKTGFLYEIIFIDDGSTDGSAEILRSLSPAKAVIFSRNFGKSQALQAGFDAATGEYVITMDGDLQDNPIEIPRFVEALEKGTSLVCGWKAERKDPFSKRFLSKIANGVSMFIARSPVHDMNCGFKGYRRDILPHLSLYGDMHRYIPAIVMSLGFSVSEIKVHHRPRKHGVSKYGWGRLFSGLFDFLTLLLLRKFTDRPMHLFGLLGMVLGFFGSIILLYLAWIRLVEHVLIGDRPLLLLGILLVITGLNFFSLGLIGELLIRQKKDERLFAVRERFEH